MIIKTWHDAPKYRVANLSQLLDDAGSILTNNTHCRIILDINISYEEANYIKETFATDYNLREISLMPSKKDNVSGEDWDTDGDISVENVDSIVLSQLEAITSNSIRNETLISIYNDFVREAIINIKNVTIKDIFLLTLNDSIFF